MKYRGLTSHKKISVDINKTENSLRERGSAMILLILLLGFFTAIALNIFYLGQKKGEEAYDKVQGEKVTNHIDIASSIGYQEMALAETLVKKGMVYDSDNSDGSVHPAAEDNYTPPTTDKFYLNGDGSYDHKYSGVQLNGFIQYFDSHWDYDLEDTEDDQKLIQSETVTDGEVESREWQSGGVPTKALKLWEITDEIDEMRVSIGGYRLTELFLTNLTDSKDEEEVTLGSDVKSSIESELSDDKEYLMRAVFEKIVKLDQFEQDGETKIQESRFLIKVEEEVNFDTNDGIDLNSKADFSEGEISMEIEKLN